MINEILLIPDKTDIERDSIADCWKKNGGEIKRIGKFWEHPNIDPHKRITIYGIDTFSLVLAQILGVKLIEPRDELLSELDFNWIKRNIEIIKISEINRSIFPIFIKPIKPKTFRSKVYNDYKSFIEEIKGIKKNEQVIKSTIIEIESEVRAFILHNEILDMAIYKGNSDLNAARKFLIDFLQNHTIDLPKTYVIDVGYHQKNGWYVIEFNSSWGAGLNSCDPNKVINGIRLASVNT